MVVVHSREGGARYLRGAGRGPVWGEPDEIAVRLVALLRVAAAMGVAAVGSFLPPQSSGLATLFLVMGLLWVPWASAVLLATDRAESRLAIAGGPAGDLAALFALQWFNPSAGHAVLLGVAAVVTFGAYTGGRRLGTALACVALMLTIVAQNHAPDGQRVGPASLTFFAVTVAALVMLLNRTTSIQRSTAARSAHLESKSAAILARVADAVVVTDSGGRVLQCNKAAEQITGTREADAVGRSCATLLGLHRGERPLDCTHGCALLATATSSTKGVELGQEVWRSNGDRRQPLLANASAVTGLDGVIMEVVHSIRDVTRIKQADEAKTLFLATASHELKTPLVVIKGFAEALLTNDLAPDVQREALEAIQRRSVELSRIVDRLLLSSRIEAGHSRVSLSQVEIGPVIEEPAQALERATGRLIALDIPDDLPSVMSDTTALITVVEHLLENAIKYSPGGEAVQVSATAEQDYVRIEIADRGVGMDAEQLAHCFEKFWQAETTDVRRFGGTGIGLYIVQSLVEAIGGRIEVTSEPGRGTNFAVCVPCHAGVPPETPTPSKPMSGERSIINEFRRQIGVPERSEP